MNRLVRGGSMSDGDALLAAILAEPDADLPRLVFADWLDEYGGEPERARAEFIRVQMELSRAPAGARRVGALARERALLSTHGEAWLEPLRERGGPLPKTVAHAEFRRGFVERVWMPAAWFVARAESLFASVPVRELRLTRTTVPELAEVLASPYFPRLNALDLSDRRLGDDAATVLAMRPSVAAIRTLRLRGCGLTDVGAWRLADAAFDWTLAELDVPFNSISDFGLAALRARFGAGVVFPERAS
jgi:uncharacterized protein (TIGR02996 family)